MRIKRLYLAHPFPTRLKIREWEIEFEKRTGIELINPFYDRNRKDVEKIDKGLLSPYDLKRQYISIVEGDLKAINESDGIVAYHRHGTPAWGTPMEVIYTALMAKKPVFIVTNKPGHPWSIYMARKSGGFVVTTLKQFEERLITEVLDTDDEK